MRTTTTATVQVAAPRHTVFRFVSDLAALAAWNNPSRSGKARVTAAMRLETCSLP